MAGNCSQRTVPGRMAWALVLLGLLSGCAAMPGWQPQPSQPMTLPPADGRAAEVGIGDGFLYVVNLQSLQQAQGGIFLRVTRATAPEMDYSDGLTAKKVAEAYCAGFGRHLHPAALGSFSLPASWLFEGGCA